MTTRMVCDKCKASLELDHVSPGTGFDCPKCGSSLFAPDLRAAVAGAINGDASRHKELATLLRAIESGVNEHTECARVTARCVRHIRNIMLLVLIVTLLAFIVGFLFGVFGA